MKRVSYFKGNPKNVGLANGRALGSKLDSNISKCFTGINQYYGVDFERLKRKALPWMRSLIKL